MLTNRSQEKELLDIEPALYTEEEYTSCLEKLFLVGKLLGINRDTVRALKKISATTLVDIGCGGGLFLIELSKFFPQIKMTGSDISEKAIDIAKNGLKEKPTAGVTFEVQKETALSFPENSIDALLATLVCHHMSDDELIVFLQQAFRSAKQAVIINDLHRHFLARWLFALMAPFIFRNRLITHDGLISIKRSFTRSDWHLLLQRAGISQEQYSISWRFPFRWQVVIWKKL